MQSLRMSAREVYELYAAGEPVIFVDVRNPTAWAQSDEKIPRAVRIPLDELPSRLHELDRVATIITYCT